MNIVLCSSFRSSLHYLRRYLSQCDELDTRLQHAGHKLSFIWAEGDSTDGTLKMLTAAKWRFKAEIVDATHGGPAFGSIVNLQRFRQLAYVANQVWERLPTDADAVLWVESDLIWEADTLVRLLARLSEVPVVAPMILENPPSQLYYDVWAHRCNGQQFTKQLPYHAAIESDNSGLLEMDSVGSIIAMRGEVARSVYVPIEDVLVGTCRMIREEGWSVWLDTGLKAFHP